MNHSYLYIILAVAIALLIFVIIWRYFFTMRHTEENIKAHTRLLKMIEVARRITKECKDRIDAIRKRL